MKLDVQSLQTLVTFTQPQASFRHERCIKHLLLKNRKTSEGLFSVPAWWQHDQWNLKQEVQVLFHLSLSERGAYPSYHRKVANLTHRRHRDTENWHSELCLWIVGGSHTERPRPGVGADLRTFWLWGISATFTLICSLFNRSHTSSGKNYCLLGLLYLNFTQLSATSGRHIGSHGRQFRDGGEELHLDLLFLHLRRFRTQSACLLGTFPWRSSNHSWVKLDPEETRNSLDIHPGSVSGGAGNHCWRNRSPGKSQVPSLCRRDQTSVSIHFIQTELLALDFVGLLSLYCLEMFDFSSFSVLYQL